MNRRTTMLIGATLLGFLITASHAAFAQADSPQYDLVIRHGAVYDGTGAGAIIQDLAVQGDRIAALGDLSRAIGVMRWMQPASLSPLGSSICSTTPRAR